MNAIRQMWRGTRNGATTRPGWSPYPHVTIAIAIAVISSTLAGMPAASAQESRGSAELEAKLDSPGTIMLRNASLADWAFAIKKEWGINIVYGAELQNENVDAGFEDTPLRVILSELLFVRGFGFQPVGNSLRIVRLEDLGAMRPGFETAIIPLDVLQPSEVQSSVKMLASTGATIESVPASRSLIVIDTPVQIERIKAHLTALEANAKKHAEKLGLNGTELNADGIAVQIARQKVEVFSVQFLKVEDLISTIETVAPEAQVGIIVEENRLVVSAPPTQMAAVADLIKRLDVARQQVRITALLYDVDLEVLEQFGFNWSHAAKGRLNASGDPNSLFAGSSTNFPARPSSSPLPGSAIIADTAATAATNGALGGLTTLTNLSRHFDISAVIRTLDTTDGSRLLARPNIVAYDRTEAAFNSVSEIPIQALTQTEAGGNIGTTSYREAGIKLTVTPQIMKDGTIVMHVAPEFSVLAGFQDGQPIIDRRSATTTIQIFDGQTTVIGGLLRRSEFEKQSGLPGLSKMKYFGSLFRDHDTRVNESELLVFIKAEIIPMGHFGSPREEAAKTVANDLVENIPVASHAPITPYCGDPYCPYHHPRPWGSALPPSACSRCIEGNALGHGIGEHPDYYGPTTTLGPATQVPTTQVPTTQGPATQGPTTIAPEVIPLPATSEPPPLNSQLPRPSASSHGDPPPVVVDEARLRSNPTPRTAIRRLPPVTSGAQMPRNTDRSRPQLPSERVQPFAPPRSVNVASANRSMRPLPAVDGPRRPSAVPERQAASVPWWKKLVQ